MSGLDTSRHSQKMRAMVLGRYAAIEESPLRLEDVPIPEPKENEIRIKVSHCGICRTDLHIIENEIPKHLLPIIPGHQIVGTVEKRGANVVRFRGGERVGIAWLRSTCGKCEYCSHEKENLCLSSQYTGYDAHGGFAEYAVVREDFCYELPKNFEDAEATPLLCAGIIGYRALKRSDLRPDEILALFGFGSSAHIVIQIALHRQCKVFVITRGAEHRRLAREMGATWVAETITGIPESVNSAIIFAPAGELVPQALSILKKGGTLSLAGIHMSDIPSLKYEEHLFYEKNIHSVTANTRVDGFDLLREASEANIKPHIKIYSLEDANQALQDLKADKISGTGVLKIS